MKVETLKACQVCKENVPEEEMMQIELLAEPIVDYIKRKKPALMKEKAICLDCLNHIRAEYIQEVLAEERIQLRALEENVIKNMDEQKFITRNINTEFEQHLTIGQKVADKVASFGGSWKFIIMFAVIIIVWITFNSIALMKGPFDPYPFILLNLVLSCLAALQAPIIMMSQNRHSEKDRLQADHDYKTNLKAELEIRQLNWKIDQLMMRHWQSLLEIQEVQTDLIGQIANKKQVQTN